MKPAFAAALAASMTLSACATQRQAEGATAGAVGAALVAGPVGAVLGAGAGAVVAAPGGPAGGTGRTCHWTDLFGNRHSYGC